MRTAPHLEAHPDALGVDPEAIAERRVRVAVGEDRRLLAFSLVADGGDGVGGGFVGRRLVAALAADGERAPARSSSSHPARPSRE
jgi:hypothetical protein